MRFDVAVISLLMVGCGVVYFLWGANIVFPALGRLHHAYRRGTTLGDINYWGTRVGSLVVAAGGVILAIAAG
jgi:hypothetical protein